MSTVKFNVPHNKFKEVFDTIKQSGVKYYPIRRMFFSGNYMFEIDDHPIVSYLILKYDLNTLNSDDPMLH